MNKLFLMLLCFVLVACSGGSGTSGADPSVDHGSLEAILAANDSWPYEIVGVLDIVEAGYGDSDEPEWAVGSIVTEHDVWGVAIEIPGAVISRAGINIDSGNAVRAWLDAPKDDYGVTTYPVSRLEVP